MLIIDSMSDVSKNWHKIFHYHIAIGHSTIGISFSYNCSVNLGASIAMQKYHCADNLS